METPGRHRWRHCHRNGECSGERNDHQPPHRPTAAIVKMPIYIFDERGIERDDALVDWILDHAIKIAHICVALGVRQGSVDPITLGQPACKCTHAHILEVGRCARHCRIGRPVHPALRATALRDTSRNRSHPAPRTGFNRDWIALTGSVQPPTPHLKSDARPWSSALACVSASFQYCMNAASPLLPPGRSP